MCELALKDLCVQLWPAEPIPKSYFRLVQKLRDAPLRVDAMKRPTCLKGARLAFAKTMVHWPKINLMDMASGPPPKGKEHRRLELYFTQVMDGARTIEGQCPKFCHVDLMLYNVASGLYFVMV